MELAIPGFLRVLGESIGLAGANSRHCEAVAGRCTPRQAALPLREQLPQVDAGAWAAQTWASVVRRGIDLPFGQQGCAGSVSADGRDGSTRCSIGFRWPITAVGKSNIGWRSMHATGWDARKGELGKKWHRDRYL